MIVEYIRYDMKVHAPQVLIDAYARAADHLRAAPECLGYHLAQRIDDPTQVILRIHWTSAEDHMRKFRSGPHFPAFLAEIRPFIGEIAEMKHYRETDVAWHRPA